MPIGIHVPPTKISKPKLQTDKAQRQMVHDYHLLFNHAPPSTIMKNLANPQLQFDPKTKPDTTHVPMHCSPFRNAKLRSRPHNRADHKYTPAEAIYSDVAGPFNYNGQRLDEAYFITCIDTASRYALCNTITDRT